MERPTTDEQREVERLRKTNAALRARVQRLVDTVGGEVSILENNVVLQRQVAAQTRGLREANEALRHEIGEHKATLTKLERQKQRAEQATAAKSQFLAAVSHELRTPLNSMLGMLELLSGKSVDEEFSEQLNTARGSGHTLLGIISQMLDYTTLDRGIEPSAVRAFDPHRLLVEVTDHAATQGGAKGLAVGTAWSGPRVVSIEGHLDETERILGALLSNAIKFTDEGSVRIDAGLDSDHERLTISVTDTGVGIAPEALETIFGDFVQVDGGAARRHGGTGLGLGLVRRWAERIGATVDADSQLGTGSTFRLHLPVRGLQLEEPVSPEASGGARVLVVDDCPVNLKVASRMLDRLGHDVATVPGGAAALERLAAEPFDLVLMDCMMPEMDGYEATRRIRAAAFGSDLPIVAVTADATHGNRERCLAAGMDDFVAKPLTLAKLRNALAVHARAVSVS